MDESQSELNFNISNSSNNGTIIDIPIELVSEEEMASIEAALASASAISSLSTSTVPEFVMSAEEMASIESALAFTSLSTLSSSVAPKLVSQEDMASIEAALAASTRSSLSSSAICSTSQSQFQRNARSIQSITLRAKRRFSLIEPDIEDMGSLRSNQKKSRVAESFLHRFRNKTGLFVSDITSTEWCKKQMEFILLFGKRKNTEAMKIGIARHAILEDEVVKKVELHLNSDEDRWAVKLTNFIIGANQLFREGLTRELPLISFAEGVWMVGVVDEVRMPVTETDRLPIFIDTKTRVTNTLPAEPQRRKGRRLQLMCYKYLWDKLVSDSFPSKQFFDFFSLDPYYLLSEEIRENTAKAGFPVKTLDDVVSCYISTCSTLPPSQHKLLLRYEYQKDNSLLGEEQFAYDSDWLKSQILGCLEFWKGEREANCTPKEERWKCWFCQFSSVCPTNTVTLTNSNSTLS